MEIKFDVYFKKNLGTLFKSNEVDLDGIPAYTNLDLKLIDRLEINYKVGTQKYTDIVGIIDVEERVIQIPFKSDVVKAGLNEFEIVAYMVNGDVKISQTYGYHIAESIGTGLPSTNGDNGANNSNSSLHTHVNIEILNSITKERVYEWDNKAEREHEHNNYANITHSHNEYATKKHTHNINDIDLSNYYTKTETDEIASNKADRLHIHSEYLTELPSHKHSEYLTQHQDISHKANIFDVYTKAQADSKILEEITKAQLGESNEVDLSNYATKNYVDDEISKIELKEGPQGPQGDRGPQGPKGDTGTVDTSNFYNKGEVDNFVSNMGNEIMLLKNQIPLDLQTTLNDILLRINNLEDLIINDEIISNGLVVNITNKLSQGTVIDDTSGEAYTTTVSSSNEGLVFSSNYIELPAEKINLSADFTIQIKHKFSKLVAWSKLFGNESSSTSNVLALGVSTGNYMLHCTNSSSDKIVNQDLPVAPVIDKYCTISVVKEGANISVYLDRDEIFTYSNIKGVSTDNKKWYIGRNGSNSNGYFNGTISRILIYNKALSRTEIFGNLKFL